METKQCKCCGRILPLGMFNKVRRRNGDDLIQLSTCVDCVKEKQRVGREKAKKEKAKAVAEMNAVLNEKLTVLSQFTPRELMEELARRGYKGELKFTQVIDITNF